MPIGNGHLRRRRSLGAYRRRERRGASKLTPFLAALSFLTVFPFIGRRSFSQREISDSRAYYPTVGLFLGLLLVGVELGGRELFPVYLTAALLLVVLVMATRGLHLDGFMDVCDGLFGGYTRERRLEIMRDSNVGAFAVAGAASLLILKYGALLSLLTIPSPGKEWSLLLFPMMSRWSMVVALEAFPYVRGDGLGSPFHEGGSRLATFIAVLIAVLASAVLGGIGGIGLLFGASVLAWFLGKVMSNMLGGLTGDSYGAINEVTEVGVLVAAVALLPHGLIEPLPALLGVF
ncbi:MAG TPA: adenosylcobinamide-GDP ribazoletransferase [Dehalococcoidia bacterium]|nr:adenosylcobinamide-GDP ribazoletransferase [Dehalococcoidia bacterium]